MSKFLYPIFKLPNEYKQDLDVQEVPLYIKWWLYNHYKKSHSWIISEIITGNPLTLNDSVQAKFPMPPLPRGNSEQVQYSGKNKLNVSENLAFTRYYLISASLPAGTYKVTYSSETHGGTNKPGIRFDNNNITGVLENKETTFTLTTDETNVYLYSNGTSYANSAGIDATINQLMISTTGGDYEPYVGGTASPNPSYPQEITNVSGDVEVLVQNKNIANLDTLFEEMKSFNSNYCSKETVNGKECILFNTTVYRNAAGFKGLQGIFKENTRYRVNLKARIYDTSITSGNEIYVDGHSKDGTRIGRNNHSAQGNTWVDLGFITAENTSLDYIAFSYGTGSQWYITDLSITEYIEGEEYTYTPHKEQTYTFPLGTQRMYLGDYLADDGIHHVRGETTLTNVNSLSTVTIGGVQCKFGYITIQGIKNQGSNPSSNFYCNKVKYYNGTYGKYQGYITLSNFVVLTDLEDTVANFNSQISGSKLQYPLAEEEITPYTTEQQQAYDEIKQAISYEEQTNISGSSDESNPIFEVQYYKRKEE